MIPNPSSPPPPDAAMDHHNHHQSWASAAATDLSGSDPIVRASRSAQEFSSPNSVAESDRMTSIRSPHIIDTRISDSPIAAGMMASGSDRMDSNLHLASISANLRPLKRCMSPEDRENQTDSAKISPKFSRIKPIECRQIERTRHHNHRVDDPSRSGKNLEESDDDDDWQSEEAGRGCVTPTTKEFRIPEPKICPPAPRKKRHRRRPSSAHESRTVAMAAQMVAINQHSNSTAIRSPDSRASGFDRNSDNAELSSSDRSAIDPLIHNCRSENSICFFRPQPDELHTIPDSLKSLFSN